MMLSQVETHTEMMKPRSLNVINEAFRELYAQIKLTVVSVLAIQGLIPTKTFRDFLDKSVIESFMSIDTPPCPFCPIWQKTFNQLYKWGCIMEPFTPGTCLYTFLSSDEIADYNDMFFEPQILLFLGFSKIQSTF